jgi:hypothetical protein
MLFILGELKPLKTNEQEARMRKERHIIVGFVQRKKVLAKKKRFFLKKNDSLVTMV